MEDEDDNPVVLDESPNLAPAPKMHPEVCSKMSECDRLYLEAYGVEHAHRKSCAKLIALGSDLDPERLENLCLRYCKRWTYPF